jgi:diguanylate cyclase (GGDEF)-like protein
MVVLDKNRIVIGINATALALGDWQQEHIIGELFTGFELTDSPTAQLNESWWMKVDRFGQWQDELNGINAVGSPRCLSLELSLIETDDKSLTYYAVMAEDISDKRAAEDELEKLAYYDSLTGLPNRAFFQENLRRDVIRVQRQKKCLAILYMNLDRFKFVNDYLGHNGGDNLLRQVSTRLLSVLSDTDIVSRQSSDEFAIALIEPDSKLAVEQTAQRIIEIVSAPYDIGSDSVSVGTSVGICMVPEHGDTLAKAMQAARAALAVAKHAGKGCFRYASVDSWDDFGSKTKIEADLRSAISDDQLMLHFQPQNNTASGDIIGFEALVRWNHPELGVIMPDQFITIAEQSGLVVALDCWVMDKACAQMSLWREQGLELVPMSVNLSALNFLNDSLAESIAAVLEKYNIPANMLDVEITESSVLQDAEQTIRTLEKLNDLGVLSSIDDFGTGYSSLSYLKRLPVTRLKIDGSLVLDIAVNDSDKSIVKTIIELGKNLSLDVIAEGVETEVQRLALASLGCKLLQGYLYSKPMPGNEAADYLFKAAY